jgi:endonuclease/exonuclease/phosphatase family metal-dependent hydrolase
VDVRVATFNIRTSRAFDGLHSWPLRRHVAVAAIHRLDADIIGVQELHARPRAFLLGHLAEYDAAGEGRDRNGRGEQCALLARTARFTIGEHRTRWFGSTPDRPGSRLPGAGAPRIVTTATLRDIHHGVEIDVWNTHLDERRAVNRVRSAEQLAAWVRADRPTIVVGDFNAERDDRDVFRPLE